MSELLDHFYGKIYIENIINYPVATEAWSEFDSSNLKCVHYHDCQQLVLWLPNPYLKYTTILIKDTIKNDLIYNKNVSDIINGSVQIILDSLFIYPGDFVLQILVIGGVAHEIYISKMEEGKEIIPKSEDLTDIDDTDNQPIIYKDGFGNDVPNLDLEMREKIIKKTINKVFRRLEFFSHGRDGEVVYIEGDTKLHFYMEMGGGNCIFYLNIPSKEQWESVTKLPLNEREDILNYIAEGTQREQAPSSYFTISDTEISYFWRRLRK
jgi:hypothetical protein